MKDLKDAVKEIQGFQAEILRAKLYLELGPYNIGTILEELAEQIEIAQEKIEDQANIIEALSDSISGLEEDIVKLEGQDD